MLLLCLLSFLTPAAALVRPAAPSSGRNQISLCAAGPSVLAVGEALFDGLPDGITLGGAPLNVAVHVAELGGSASFCGAVGADRLGLEVARRLASRGVDCSLLSTVAQHETGFVSVDVGPTGDASYSFVTPAAWDFIEGGPALTAAAASADAMVYGTLAQRAPGSRAAVRAAAASSPLRVCDVNIRPPYISDELLASAVLAPAPHLLKLNEDELAPLAAALARHAATPLPSLPRVSTELVSHL